MIAPVGQLSRHPARAQCLHTSEENSQENAPSSPAFNGTGRSINATCRHVDAPRCTVLSYDIPVNRRPSSGSWFHCLQATSQALHPIQRVVSVKNPVSSRGSGGSGRFHTSSSCSAVSGLMSKVLRVVVEMGYPAKPDGLAWAPDRAAGRGTRVPARGGCCM